ncbi:Vacuolar ATP synthase subunit D [Giardia muris]|uniref:Vacuolar ATP synthase subunit D n=1 Tax=Giardia muris TaxID=5742 RepID=A0A4Z1SSL1_GIAMU|nr:Vacuolar ATP synthase subunit D [Giardia muris]|eukprot:TNJ26648.1 Vacuolar ATP synthase subunit D [Giardia muris]
MSEQRLNVLPTKMQLAALKQRRAASERGHSLLKKKLDAMTLQYRALVSQLADARESMLGALREANWALSMAQRSTTHVDLYSELASNLEATPRLTVQATAHNVAGVRVSSFTLCDFGGRALDEAYFAAAGRAEGLALGLATNLSQLADARQRWLHALSAMVFVAGLQRSCTDLGAEIKVTSRRVNAIEYLLLPRIENTISWISDSLDENEREEFARIKKVADGRRAAAEAERQADEAADAVVVDAADDQDILF